MTILSKNTVSALKTCQVHTLQKHIFNRRIDFKLHTLLDSRLNGGYSEFQTKSVLRFLLSFF